MRGPSASKSVSDVPGTRLARWTHRDPSRSHALPAVCFFLLALAAASAAEASLRITGEDLRREGRSTAWIGFEVSPTFTLPLPVATANHDAIGLDAGLSCTARLNPVFGIGASGAYHYWPVSAEFKREFNEFLRSRTLNILELGGGAWGLQALHLGGHVRIAAPPRAGVRPWIQVGAGGVRVDPHTTGYVGDAGFFTVVAKPLRYSWHFGYSVGLGADMIGGPSPRLGLEATFHEVACSELYGENLRIFSLGVRAIVSR